MFDTLLNLCTWLICLIAGLSTGQWKYATLTHWTEMMNIDEQPTGPTDTANGWINVIKYLPPSVPPHHHSIFPLCRMIIAIQLCIFISLHCICCGKSGKWTSLKLMLNCLQRGKHYDISCKHRNGRNIMSTKSLVFCNHSKHVQKFLTFSLAQY